jgi:hypothetical protein
VTFGFQRTIRINDVDAPQINLNCRKHMDSYRTIERIRENAAEIVRLHSRIHETVKHRTKNPEKRREWEQGAWCPHGVLRRSRGDPANGNWSRRQRRG